MKNDVFGREGDFITSPEVSQVFGEVSHFSITFIEVRLFIGFLFVCFSIPLQGFIQALTDLRLLEVKTQF